MVLTATLPPGPRQNFYLKTIPALQRMGFVEFNYHVVKEYGTISSVYLGPLLSVNIADADLVQTVMVKRPENYIKGASHDRLRSAIGNGILTLEGEKWAQQRKLMQPTYTPKNVQVFADIMTRSADEMIARWAQNSPDTVFNVGNTMTQITMQIISLAMFDIDISQNYQQAITSLMTLLEYTSSAANRIIAIPEYIPTPLNRRLKASKAYLHTFIMDIVRQRRAEGFRDDLLSMLMTSKDEETGDYMTDEQLYDEILITIFAGHETTANLLTWTWYLLSQHPEIEARLHEELDQVLGGRTPTQADIPSLRYTKMVLDEVLRLYAPTPVLARDVVATDELAGYTVPKGSMAVILPYAIHRDPRYWTHPLTFDPDHFLPEQVEQRPRYAYMPFGAGRRICIGLHFAQLEATLLLAALAQRYRVRLAAPNDGSFTFVGVARPRHPVMVTVQPR